MISDFNWGVGIIEVVGTISLGTILLGPIPKSSEESTLSSLFCSRGPLLTSSFCYR